MQRLRQAQSNSMPEAGLELVKEWRLSHDSTEHVGHFAGVRARSSVDQPLRTMQQNFTQLSTAADHKANIVIGFTLLMLGLLVGTKHAGRTAVAAYVMAASLKREYLTNSLCSCAQNVPFHLHKVVITVSHSRPRGTG